MITNEARPLVALVPLNGTSLTVVLFLSMFHAGRQEISSALMTSFRRIPPQGQMTSSPCTSSAATPADDVNLFTGRKQIDVMRSGIKRWPQWRHLICMSLLTWMERHRP
jgi:hypothetical protein